MSEQWSEDDLRTAYAPAAREKDAGHRADCPSGDALLAALRGEGPEGDRLRILDAALTCEACRRELALLRAVAIAPARGSSGASSRTWRRFVPLAAAASIVFVVGIIGIARWRQGQSDDVVRASNANGPVLLAPASGSTVQAGQVTFRWRSVPNALRYTLELSAADGTVLGSTRTADTVIAVSVPAAPRGEHRWWVRAHMDNGSERRSETRLMRVR